MRDGTSKSLLAPSVSRRYSASQAAAVLLNRSIFPAWPFPSPDSGDNLILAALIVGEAECLVCGDTDLLALRDRYAVVTPAEFVRQLQ